MIPWNPCPPSRGIRAHLAVEFVPAIAWNSQLDNVEDRPVMLGAAGVLVAGLLALAAQTFQPMADP